MTESNQYLWDASGIADPDVEELELALAEYAPPAVDVDAPAPPRPASRGPKLIALAASLVAGLVVWQIAAPGGENHEASGPAAVHRGSGSSGSEPGVALPATPAPREPAPPAAANEEVGSVEDDVGAEPSAESVGIARVVIDAGDDDRLARVRESMIPVEAATKTCAREHGVLAGTQVRLELAVRGSDGVVVSAIARGPGTVEAVASCTLDRLRDVRFPRSHRASEAVMVSVEVGSR